MENTGAANWLFQSQGTAQQAEGVPRYRQIYEALLMEISSGKLKPGDQLPSEKELCEVFQVSRITSKKALEMLAANRLISRQRGRGSFVVETAVPPGPGQDMAAFRSIAFLISAFNDSFGNQLIRSVEAACEEQGYHLILKLTHESPAEEEEALRALDNENVAGILMLPVHGEYYNAEILRQILNGRPLVFVDRKMQGLPVPSVSTDCLAAAEMAVMRLFDQGHRHIAFYSGPVIHTSTVEDRRKGFARAFARQNASLNTAHMVDSITPMDNIDVITRHLTEYPDITAAFTAEFEIALQVRRALLALGRQIPRDFALVTFDRPPYAAEFPEISCLQQDEDAIGRAAVEVLLRVITGESGRAISDILVPARLINSK